MYMVKNDFYRNTTYFSKKYTSRAKCQRVRGQVIEPSVPPYRNGTYSKKTFRHRSLHAILRGVNKQQIFECTEDYQRFLNILRAQTFQFSLVLPEEFFCI